MPVSFSCYQCSWYCLCAAYCGPWPCNAQVLGLTPCSARLVVGWLSIWTWLPVGQTSLITSLERSRDSVGEEATPALSVAAGQQSCLALLWNTSWTFYDQNHNKLVLHTQDNTSLSFCKELDPFFFFFAIGNFKAKIKFLTVQLENCPKPSRIRLAI